jgi:hypothetical protein
VPGLECGGRLERTQCTMPGLVSLALFLWFLLQASVKAASNSLVLDLQPRIQYQLDPVLIAQLRQQYVTVSGADVSSVWDAQGRVFQVQLSSGPCRFSQTWRVCHDSSSSSVCRGRLGTRSSISMHFASILYLSLICLLLSPPRIHADTPELDVVQCLRVASTLPSSSTV